MVIDLFGCSLDVEDVFLTKVNVFVQKQRRQVALQVATVLHHDGTGDCVTPIECMCFGDGSVEAAGCSGADHLKQEHDAVAGLLGDGQVDILS